MEIQSADELPGCSEQRDITNIMREASKQSSNLKKMISLSLKAKNQHFLWESLVSNLKETTDIQTKVNLYLLLAEIMTINKTNNQEIYQHFLWIFSSVYEIRYQLDTVEGEPDKQLQFLNKLLKLMFEVLTKSLKVESPGMQQSSLTTKKLYQQIYALQRKKQFRSLPNILFSLNIMAKLEFFDEESSLGIINLMKHYFKTIQNVDLCQIQIQEVCFNTLVKCLQKIPILFDHYQNIIEKSPFYVQLLSMLRFGINNHQFSSNSQCSFEEQFDLMTQILEKYYRSSSNEMKINLNIWWLDNCYSFMNNSLGSCDISSYLRDLSEEILLGLLHTVNRLFDSYEQNQHRAAFFIIWKTILLEDRMKTALPTNQALFKSVQLVLYRFVREASNIIPSTLNIFQIRLIFQVYSHYYQLMLRQSSSQALRRETVTTWIKNYLDLLRPIMLVNQDVTVSQQYPDIDAFNKNMLRMIFEVHYRNYQDFNNILRKVKRNMGAIVIKYLISFNIDIKQIFSGNQVVEYLIQNNIEVHSDKIDYLLYEKISNNLEKIIKLLRSSKKKNIYEKKLLQYILSLLENQLIENQKVKVLTPTFNITIFLLEKFNVLLETIEEKGQTINNFIASLYRYASRCLFLHFPDLIYLLLLIISELKSSNSDTVLREEYNFIQNLEKFCIHYSSHHTYSLIGYVSILLIVFRPLETNHNHLLDSNYQKFFEEREFFIPKLSELLMIQGLFKKKWFNLQRKNSEIKKQLYEILWQVVKKNCIYNILLNLKFAFSFQNGRFQSKISSMRKQIQFIVDDRAISQASMNFDLLSDRKRQFSFSEDDEELQHEKLHTKTHLNKLQKVKKQQQLLTFLDILCEKYKLIDQFKFYQEIDEYFISVNDSNVFSDQQSNMFKRSTLQRVHGKIRSIIHVKRQ